MVKRGTSVADEDERQTKRPRPNNPDRISALSHELILRVLSFLPVPDLIVCQRYGHLDVFLSDLC